MKIRAIAGACMLLFAGTTGTALAQSMVSEPVVYNIQKADSVLRVFVGRAGLLARLGHNHVIRTRDLEGQIVITPRNIESTATFLFPVESLEVDNPQERERAGSGYDSQPGASAIAGTRDNMLGNDVLNSSEFPDIRVNIATSSVAEEQWLFAIELELQGRLIDFEIPATLIVSDASVSVHADFSLTHEQLGLSPFTALGGTLRVADTLDFELAIEAQAAEF